MSGREGGLPISVEIEMLDEELGRERRGLAISERAEHEGRVADYDRWQESLRRRRKHIWKLEGAREALVREGEKEDDGGCSGGRG
jgi:hypothetical protein